MICRDLARAYSDGGTRGAVHVAARGHLRHNLGEAFKRAVARHRQYLTAMASASVSAAQDQAGARNPASLAAERSGGSPAEPAAGTSTCTDYWPLSGP